MTKQEEVRRFLLRDKELVHSSTAGYLDEATLKEAILENNESFEIMRDPMRLKTIVYCKNKPRDLPIYGIVWEALDD